MMDGLWSNQTLHTTTMSPQTSYNYQDAKVIAYYVIRLTQSLLALTGNSLTILAIMRTPALRTGTNVFVGSLAVADLLSSAVAPITVTVIYNWHNPAWVPLCVTKMTTSLLFEVGNLYSVFYIALDRYLAVAAPIRHLLYFTMRTVLVLSMATWGLLATIIILFFSLAPRPKLFVHHLQCFYTEILPSWVYNAIILPQFLGFSLATVLLYGRMCFLVWQNGIRVGQTQRQILVGLKPHAQTRQRKLTRTLTLVMGVYLTFTLPALTMRSFVNNLDPEWLKDLNNVAIILWYNCSFVNPILYTWQAPGFRKAFRQILHLPCKDKPAM